MLPATTRRIALLAEQLSEALMTASLCAEEIRTIVSSDFSGTSLAQVHHPVQSSSNGRNHPILNESTFSVKWNGNAVHLGNTVGFRLLARLARRPNHYVTHFDLLEDVWDGMDRMPATIASTVRHLRQKLRDGGMPELADAIRGDNGHYVLDL